MKMHRNMIRTYLWRLTMGEGASRPDPVAGFEQYNGDIYGMRTVADMQGNLDWLRLSMDALIANPEGRIQLFAGQLYPFTDDELVGLFRYAYQRIWPDQEISEPGDELDIEFAEMTDEEWAAISGG